jgi:hypothetical protein
MEDVAREDGGGRWPVARFALAARHLGRFSGRSLVAGPLPDAPWLNRAVLRGRIDQNADFWEGRLRVSDEGLLGQIFPGGLIDRARRVWDERHQLLDLLDRLPQTLVHGDCDRRNLFARRDAAGEEETAAIDWAWLGVAAVGWDLANLVVASALWYEAEIHDLPALAEACLAGYIAGLTDAGSSDDSIGTSENACVGPILHLPERIEQLEIGTAINDQDTALLGCELQLVVVANSPIAATDVMHRYRIYAARTQSRGHCGRDVFVEEKAEGHGWSFRAIRTSISSGYAS